MDDTKEKPPFNLLIIGESKVGKSSLRNYLLGRPMRSGKYHNSDSVTDVFETDLDDELTIMMYDIANIDQLKEDEVLQEKYLKDTHMVLLMFAIDQKESFEKTPELMTMVLNQNKKYLMPFALVGNKKDLRVRGGTFVSYQEAKDYADRLSAWAKIQIPYFDISLKLDDGIEPVRNFITRKQIIKEDGEVITY